jgi:hypothetical protein
MMIIGVKKMRCEECERDRNGVCFALDGMRAFLCWEHFRANILPLVQTNILRSTHLPRPVISCCSCCCACSQQDTHARGTSSANPFSDSGRGHTTTHGQSRSDSGS